MTLRAVVRADGRGAALVPSLAVMMVLHRFKRLAKTGEIPTLEHNPSARRGAATGSETRRQSMGVVCWNGVNQLSVETVDDLQIVNPHDAILKIRLRVGLPLPGRLHPHDARG